MRLEIVEQLDKETFADVYQCIKMHSTRVQ